VPTGVVADRVPRRAVLSAAGVLQAAGYVLWTTGEGFGAFAAGFVLWGLGGTFVSGALEALLHDGLAAAGAEEHLTRVLGQVTAAGLVGQLPAAVLAGLLFPAGGYALVGWVSVGGCLLAAVLAARLPEPPRAPADPDDDDGPLATLRAGLAEATARPPVRRAVLAAAVLTAIDAFEEYLPLLAQDWGVATGTVPVALLGVTLAAAVGAGLAGVLARRSAGALGAVLGVAALALAVAGVLGRPAGIAALALFYALYRAVLVVVDARLQERIAGPARATVTSVAAVGTDLASFVVYAAWALGELPAVLALVALAAAALPLALREEGREAAGRPL
jgi:MFS family permease